MIDIKEVLKNIQKMKENISARRVKFDLDILLDYYQNWKSKQTQIEDILRRSNQIANSIINIQDPQDRQKRIEEGSKFKQQEMLLKEEILPLKSKLDELLLALPNWMSSDVPIGSGEEENKEIKRVLEPTKFNFQPKDHLEIGKKLDLIDFEAGSKVAGSKFYFLKNEMVLLQHALKQFVFKKAIDQRFTCLKTPDVVRHSILQGAGFSSRGEESNTYIIEDEDLYLIATAEIPVGGIHADEILEVKQLPILYIAESHCFRKESGASGRLNKGLYRVHQFEKVELYVICTPEQSSEMLEKILYFEESIYQELSIPYRVVLNCSGDLGAQAYKKYDIEAWMPGKGVNGEYGEITSASNCTDYQSRRLGIRYNSSNGKKMFVHTLNGTAIALSRASIAIMENYQTSEGGIIIPEPLIPYLGFSYIPPRNRESSL